MTAELDTCRTELISVANRIVGESGNPSDFDAASWVDQWLKEPLPAIGTTPYEYLLAGNSCDFLIRLLLQAQSGSYG